jgi:hypothetical protein
MANSKLAGSTGAHHHHHRPHHAGKPKRPLLPASTPGPLGRNGHGDPTQTTLLGWSPNVTGVLDMLASIAGADWPKAATECHRNGPSDERNEWTKSTR